MSFITSYATCILCNNVACSHNHCCHGNATVSFLCVTVLHISWSTIYRMIQEERSVVWEVIILVIGRKKVHMNMCLILNGYRDRAIWITTPNLLVFCCGVGWRAEFVKERWLHEMNCLHFGCCCPHKGTWRSNQTTTQDQQIWVALNLMVTFSNIHCEL